MRWCLQLVVLFSSSSFWVHGRRDIPSRDDPPTTTNQCDRNQADSFFDNAFCGVAKTDTSPSNCTALEPFSRLACPTQDTVCDRSFNLTVYCQDAYEACPAECSRYLRTCCDVQCCQDSCLDASALCTVLHMATCTDGHAEVCPCQSDNRTDAAYCTALVGDTNDDTCYDKCIDFMSDCCRILPGDVRLGGQDKTTYSSSDGDRITGQLEIYMNRQWSRVCRSGFDVRDAIVACRQLGYATLGTDRHKGDILFES